MCWPWQQSISIQLVSAFLSSHYIHSYSASSTLTSRLQRLSRIQADASSVQTVLILASEHGNRTTIQYSYYNNKSIWNKDQGLRITHFLLGCHVFHKLKMQLLWLLTEEAGATNCTQYKHQQTNNCAWMHRSEFPSISNAFPHSHLKGKNINYKNILPPKM